MSILHKNIYCDPSSEPSQRDGSNEGSQHIVKLSSDTPSYLELCWPAELVVPSLIPAEAGNLFNHKWGFIAHSLLLSSS